MSTTLSLKDEFPPAPTLINLTPYSVLTARAIFRSALAAILFVGVRSSVAPAIGVNVAVGVVPISTLKVSVGSAVSTVMEIALIAVPNSKVSPHVAAFTFSPGLR